MMSPISYMLANLTLQERRAAQLIKSGCSIHRIAADLNIDVNAAQAVIDRVTEAQSDFTDRSIRSGTEQLGAACLAYWKTRAPLEGKRA